MANETQVTEPAILVLTDGKAGDRVQCLGVAEAVLALAGGGRIEERTVRPRAPFVWLMPRGPIDPRDSAVLEPPYPDVAIASGRRAVAYLRSLKRRAPGCLTVFLKDPRTGPGAAELIWVPTHDRLRGANVIATPTSPHRITAEKLVEAASRSRPELNDLPNPRVAVLVGGASKHVRFGDEDAQRLAGQLLDLARSGAGLMITPSRRTPHGVVDAITEALDGFPHWLWDGRGENPYLEILGLSDAVVVTADSVNMVGEAAATGRPIHVFEPQGVSRKVKRFLDGMMRHGAVVKFSGSLENLAYVPLDSTPLIAQEIVRRLQSRHYT